MSNGLETLPLLWAPPEKIGLADWMEKYYLLGSETGQSSLIRLTAWQRFIFDSFTDPRVREMFLMTATQLVKTTLEMGALAYTIAQDPGPALFVLPNTTDAENTSKERFLPMSRRIGPVAQKLAREKSRSSSNTITHKTFVGGTLDFVSSNIPGSLGRRTIRYIFFDEIDKMEISSGDEGNPIVLGRRRLDRFGSRGKLIAACSPTIKGQSAIDELYEDSDQCKPYVSCHLCGHFQILNWRSVIFDAKLGTYEAAKTARYVCAECGGSWSDMDRVRNISRPGGLEWRAHRPFEGRRGIWINHLYSDLPAHSMGELTKEFLRAKRSGNAENLKVFINTSLAELYELEGEKASWELARGNAEDFEVGVNAIIPQEASLLCAGVDVQQKRLEIQILAFGPDPIGGAMHVWTIDYITIELFEDNGNGKLTTAQEYWDALARLLDRKYLHASGVEIPIVAMGIDVGYNPEPVYKFNARFPRATFGNLGLRIHTPKTVLCVRGHDSEMFNAINSVSEREAARNRKGPGKDLPIVTLGSGYLKQELFTALGLPPDQKRIHLSSRFDLSYYQGLCAEKMIVSSKGGVSWVKEFPRNEPLDTWIYARGACAAIKADRFRKEEWAALRRQIGIKDMTEPAKPVALRPSVVRSPYLD